MPLEEALKISNSSSNHHHNKRHLHKRMNGMPLEEALRISKVVVMMVDGMPLVEARRVSNQKELLIRLPASNSNKHPLNNNNLL